MNRHAIRIIGAIALSVATQSALAAPPPETSLNNCQNAVKTAAKVFVTNTVTAIGSCLQAVSMQIVKNNAPNADAAAGICVAQFRRVRDSRGLGKQLSDKLAAVIVKKCAPGQPNVTHTLADIIGTGAGVSEPLAAENLNDWCSHHGGDGSIDTVQEWIDCISVAAERDADSTIAAQYPRGLEWLALVKPAMQTLTPPAADPNKITDAVAGLDAVEAEIDGPDNDNVASPQCSGGIVSSGSAAAGNVLAGVTFSNSTAAGLIGTMPDNGAVTLTPSTGDQTIAVGYHNGTGKCVGDADLVSGNIMSGVNLFGVNGDANVVDSSSGTAAEGDLLSGKVAWVTGAQVTGTMPNNGAVTLTPSTTDQTIAAGYHDGAGKCVGDADLVSGNIMSGVNLFGVSGDSNVVNTSSGTAAAGNLLSGRVAWVDGVQVTGTMPTWNNILIPTTFDRPIAAGYHDGTEYCMGDADLVSGNIRSGVSLWGVAGSPTVVNTSSATPAAATDVLSGKTAYVNGSLINGTITAGSNVSGPNGSKTFTIPNALYSASKTATANDSALVASNIINGVSIFGVTGTQLPAQRLKTGQTTSYGTGSDGALQKGLSRSYTDNGNGTITDNRTGLMWEKKSDDSGIHDKDNTYTWGPNSVPYMMNGTIVSFLMTLNFGSGFAGYTDWRIPNVNELQSIANYQNVSPAVDAAFNTNCFAGCTVTGCSCTQSDGHWSSSATPSSFEFAWNVSFYSGGVYTYTKWSNLPVRAVRGGS